MNFFFSYQPEIIAALLSLRTITTTIRIIIIIIINIFTYLLTYSVHDAEGVHVYHTVQEHSTVRFQMGVGQRYFVVGQHFR